MTKISNGIWYDYRSVSLFRDIQCPHCGNSFEADLEDYYMMKAAMKVKTVWGLTVFTASIQKSAVNAGVWRSGKDRRLEKGVSDRHVRFRGNRGKYC